MIINALRSRECSVGNSANSILVMIGVTKSNVLCDVVCLLAGVAAIMASVVPQTPPVGHPAATAGPVIR